MATINDYRSERLKKLEALKSLGIDPFPATVKRTHTTKEVVDGFDELENKPVSVVGRILRNRSFGQLAFIVIDDGSGELQGYIKAENMAKLDSELNQLGVDELGLLDSGDFIQLTGNVIKTKRGEISIEVESLVFLGKSIRPLPLGHESFTNKEERFRRRYIDTNVNDEVKQRYIRRSKFWQANRDFLNEKGFIEINIPVLEHTTGGADAKPFKTHMDALDQDFYLRISHELPLKKLIGGGYDKVYDIGPRFRNEHYTDEHLPEHIAMEWYWAYADWQDGRKIMEEMYSFMALQTFGTLKFSVKGHDVDFGSKWAEIDYTQIIKDKFNIDAVSCSLEDVKKAMAEAGVSVEDAESIPRGIDKLWKTLRKDIAGPAWLINIPLYISPLAKTNRDNPNTVQRFQAVIAGTEMGNGYSELNDPIEQLERFKQQQLLLEAGDEEAQMLDIDYVEMLEYGMPPTCGWGHSERLFWVLEGVTAREGVPFPQLRTEIDETTKSIYTDIDFNS